MTATRNRKTYSAAYRDAHKEEIRAQRAAYRVAHEDEARAYRAAHQEEIRAYRAAHKEEIRAYRAARKEEIRAQRTAYMAAHKEEIRAYREAWHAAHKEEIRAYNAAYSAANREKRRAAQARRRARKLEAEGTYTDGDVKSQYARQKGKCFWCKTKVGKAYHVDHVVPLSRGGSNWPENLVIACTKCNLQKANKLPHEWKQGGRLL